MPDRISRLTIGLAPRLRATAVIHGLRKPTRRDRNERTSVRQEQEQGALMASLEREVLDVIRNAPARLTEEERTVTLAEALKDRELESPKWCAECTTSERVPGSGDGCASHAIGLDFVDAFRRVAYRRLPGRPKNEVDL